MQVNRYDDDDCRTRGGSWVERNAGMTMEPMMMRVWVKWVPLAACLASLLVTLPAAAAEPATRNAGTGVVVMDNQGRVLKTLQAPASREELAARAADEERLRDKAKADAEQARKDHILLDSYTTESEIDLARNRASQAFEQQMEIARNYTASLGRRQVELTKAKTAAGAKGLPPAEEQELARLQAELEVQNASTTQKKQDLDRIIARYAADKRRWQEIADKQRVPHPVATSSVSTK